MIPELPLQFGYADLSVLNEVLIIMSVNRNVVVSNFFWRLFERIGAQVVSLVVSIVLARILSPTDYGTVALINVFINILSVFVNGGFGYALIQKKKTRMISTSLLFSMYS